MLNLGHKPEFVRLASEVWDMAAVHAKIELVVEGNPPLEPRGLEVEFFPKEEVLHEKVKIYR